MERHYAVLSALANRNSLRIISLLRREHTVSEIVRKTRLQQTCVSHCLARLAQQGLVSVRREGKFRKYRNTRAMEQLLQALDAREE